MSHEYLISFQTAEVDAFLEYLRSSPLFAYEKEDHISLKDKESGNSWAHDVRLFKESDHELLLEITARTNALYNAIKNALAVADYKLTEYDDKDLISLERAFRQ